MSRSTLRLVLVDDSETFLHGLGSLLAMENDMEVTGTACGGREAVELAARVRPAVVVLDLRLKWKPDEPEPRHEVGLRCIRDLQERTPDTGVLVLTGHSDPFWLIQVINAGARGFLAKEEPPEWIVSAIRAVAQGQVVLSPERLHRLRQNRQDPLTPREHNVLELTAAGRTDRAIARVLGIKPKTVGKHQENIRSKLGVHSRTEAVAEARRRGLIGGQGGPRSVGGDTENSVGEGSENSPCAPTKDEVH